MDFKIKLFYTFAALLRIGKNCYVVLRIAQVAELVDALDSKSSFFGSAGSIPALSTITLVNQLIFKGFLFINLKCFRPVSDK